MTNARLDDRTPGRWVYIRPENMDRWLNADRDHGVAMELPWSLDDPAPDRYEHKLAA